MKKKCLVMAVVATLVFSMAGCGFSAKKYEQDIDALLEIADLDWDDTEEMKDDFDELEFVTKEGIEIQEKYDKLIKLVIEEEELWEEYYEDEIDDYEFEETQEEINEKAEKLAEDIEELLEDFYDAAEDAGADEDALEDLEDEFDL